MHQSIHDLLCVSLAPSNRTRKGDTVLRQIYNQREAEQRDLENVSLDI